jgi:hypothetical protein
MNDDNEFFVGWQGKTSAKTARRLTAVSIALALSALGAVFGFAALQRTIGPARWDYGTARGFSGTFFAQPVPTLLADDGATYLLVFPNKFGFDPQTARSLDGQLVRLSGSLLQRDDQAMLEVQPHSIEALDPAPRPTPDRRAAVDLGEHTLRGEIVDSKCFLGAMNPGVLKPHRACAIRCISGGIPPMLVVRGPAGSPTCYLLIGPNGEAIHRDVLDFVAEPVEIRGRVQRLGEQLVLRARPDAIQRLP